jgi:hypothetical protein
MAAHFPEADAAAGRNCVTSRQDLHFCSVASFATAQQTKIGGRRWCITMACWRPSQQQRFNLRKKIKSSLIANLVIFINDITITKIVEIIDLGP